jgi:rhombotail lipoprotein
VPFRIGVAFVPDNTSGAFRLPESDRQKLAGEVRDSFARYPFVKEIIAVPSVYLEPAGGFSNLDRIAALLNLEVIVLVSFDQVQNAGATGWSFLYWTGIGAYVIDGDRYRYPDYRRDQRVRHKEQATADARGRNLDHQRNGDDGGLL